MRKKYVRAGLYMVLFVLLMPVLIAIVEAIT